MSKVSVAKSGSVFVETFRLNYKRVGDELNVGVLSFCWIGNEQQAHYCAQEGEYVPLQKCLRFWD